MNKESLKGLQKKAGKFIRPALIVGGLAVGGLACQPQIIVVEGKATPTPSGAVGAPTPDATDELLKKLITLEEAKAIKSYEAAATPIPAAMPKSTDVPTRVEVVVTQATPDTRQYQQPVVVQPPVIVYPGYPYPVYPSYGVEIFPPKYPSTTRSINPNQWTRVYRNSIVSGDITVDVGDGINRKSYDDRPYTGLVTQAEQDMWVFAQWGASVTTLDNPNDSYASGVTALRLAQEMLINGCGTGIGCPEGVAISNGVNVISIVRK